MNKLIGRIHLGKPLYYAVLVSFIVPIVFLSYRIGSMDTAEQTQGLHSRADYVLMLVQCILGLAAIHIPSLLSRTFKFELPGFLYGMYIIFLYCAIFLGEVRSFYYLVPHWDDFLHSMSSMMTGFFAFMFVTILNRNENIIFDMSPAFVALFAFTFSVAIGALWEIYEFSGDGFMGLNMQKFMLADGTVLVGHAALSDTMKDIVIDMLGALVASTVGFISLRHRFTWMIPKLDYTPGEMSTENVQEASNISGTQNTDA